jgi:hypothetical protein
MRLAAFLPLMLLPGIVGKFMSVIPFVVALVACSAAQFALGAVKVQFFAFDPLRVYVIIDMASIVWGLGFSTVLTLYVMPLLYRMFMGRRRGLRDRVRGLFMRGQAPARAS